MRNDVNNKNCDLRFDYFYGKEDLSNLYKGGFIRLPKSLFNEEKYRNLNNDSKYLYCLMLDRRSLSEMNGWRDEYGEVYIYYTIEEIQKELGCGNKKVSRLLKELEQCHLIKRCHQGLGYPNRILVKDIIKRPDFVSETVG
ncbi:replication initiator protein A (RepA) [Lachnospiraceae bacterium JC7]|nr:replication initiator protein A (RepA) [Lachnospiraceae bacterium JC7]